MPFDVFLKIIELVLISLEILLFQIGVNAFLIVVIIRADGLSWLKLMQFSQNKFELLFVASKIHLDQPLYKSRQFSLMSQFPHLPPPQQGIHDSTNQIPIGVIGFLESLAQIVKHINLTFKSLQSLRYRSGIQQQIGNRLQKLIILNDLFISEKSVDADINYVEIDQLNEYLLTVPNIQQNL